MCQEDTSVCKITINEMKSMSLNTRLDSYKFQVPDLSSSTYARSKQQYFL